MILLEGLGDIVRLIVAVLAIAGLLALHDCSSRPAHTQSARLASTIRAGVLRPLR